MDLIIIFLFAFPPCPSLALPLEFPKLQLARRLFVPRSAPLVLFHQLLVPPILVVHPELSFAALLVAPMFQPPQEFFILPLFS